MDYVVFGTGYGATLMLLGWALRTFAPGLRYQDAAEDAPQSAEMMMARLSWRRFATALGAIIATSGVLLIFITFILILFSAGDGVGSWVAWLCFALILLVIAAWAWFFLGRYGAYGILPERRDTATVFKTRPASAPDTSHAVPEPAREVARSVQHVRPSEADDTPEADDDSGPFQAMVDDDAYSDEQAARYARYQVHQPVVSEADDAYKGPFSPNDESFDDVDVNDESLEMDATEAPRLERDRNEDVSPETHFEQTIAQPKAPNTDTREPHVDAPTDDKLAPVTDDDDLLQAGEPETSEDLTGELKETPEGRAEALRWIEDWQPDDADEDERS